MCTQANQIALLKFERNHYRGALEALQAKLNELADQKEDAAHNKVWMMAHDALDQRKLAVAAASAGLLTDLFERED